MALEGPGLPPYPELQKCGLPISALLPNAVPREKKSYFILGFPASKSKPHVIRRDIVSHPLCIRACSAPISAYTSMGFDPNKHILLPFNKKEIFGSDGIAQIAPALPGMSGSPLWLLFDDASPNDPRQTPVVGIFIEYHKTQHVLVATDIDTALNMITTAS